MFIGFILLLITMCTVSCTIQEPKCTSLYDYEHKLLYKLIKIEVDVKAFREYLDDFKHENVKRELQQRQLYEASIAKCEHDATTTIAALKADQETALKVQADAQVAALAKLESAAEDQAEAHAAALAKMDSNAEAKTEAQAEAHAATLLKLESSAKMQAETHAEVLAQLKSDAKLQADLQAAAYADALAQLKSDAKLQADLQAEAYADAVAQLKSDAKVQSDAQADALAQLKSDAKVQAEEHAEALAQLKSDANVQAEANGAALAKLESAANAQVKAQAVAHAAALAKFESATKDTINDVKDDSGQLFKDHEAAIQNMTVAMKRVNNVKPIGFSVKDPKSTTTSGQISFKSVVSNEDAMFDIVAGEFVCKQSGFYFFSLSIVKAYYHDSYAQCAIKKNGARQVLAFTYPGHSGSLGRYAATNSIYVHLTTGDKVTVGECTSLSSLSGWSSFTGFLVKADTV